MCQLPEGCPSRNSGGVPEHCPLVEDAAHRAVHEVFAILGVDVNNPEKVEEFREDLRFGKSLRRASDRTMIAIYATIGGAIVLALWYGIVDRIRGGQ